MVCLTVFGVVFGDRLTSTFIMNHVVVWITKASIVHTLCRSCLAVLSNAGEGILLSRCPMEKVYSSIHCILGTKAALL